MNTLTKTIIITTFPTLLTTPILADAPIPPTTQPTTRPAPVIAQSNVPLVIPDGTSPQNPGPAFVNANSIQFIQLQQAQPQVWGAQQANPGQPMVIHGLRG